MADSMTQALKSLVDQVKASRLAPDAQPHGATANAAGLVTIREVRDAAEDAKADLRRGYGM